MIFGETLRTLRLAKGLQQKRVAITLEIHPSYVSHLERGKKPAPKSAAFLQQIAAALQLSSDEKARLLAAAEADQTLGNYANGANPAQATLGLTVLRKLSTLNPAKIDAIGAILRL